MGYYIDPPHMSKEEWLVAYGTMVNPDVPYKQRPAPKSHRDEDRVAVCLVHNGGFNAAAVAFSARELEAFNSPLDNRIKIWFWVPIEALAEKNSGLAPSIRDVIEKGDSR
jgi:hypothetical protein